MGEYNGKIRWWRFVMAQDETICQIMPVQAVVGFIYDDEKMLDGTPVFCPVVNYPDDLTWFMGLDGRKYQLDFPEEEFMGLMKKFGEEGDAQCALAYSSMKLRYDFSPHDIPIKTPEEREVFEKRMLAAVVQYRERCKIVASKLSLN